MKRAALDLSKGLNLTSSDPALPFRVARLPLWPKPGVGWTSHPGHDAVLTPIDPNGEVLHSDQSGGVVVRSGNTLTVHDITRGRLASGGYFDGVYIPRTGWIGNRVSPIILGLSSVSGVNLRPLELVSGSLDEGNYVIYAFTFYKLEAGLYFTWYAVANTTIAATGKGIKIALSEEPGDDRVVRLYVQRAAPGAAYSPLAFLAELRGGETEFLYVSHLQEGEHVNYAVPSPTGKFSAYYNGRHFYQATKLKIIGAGKKATPGEQTPIVDPSSGIVIYKHPKGLALQTPTIGGTPSILPFWAGMDVVIDHDNYLIYTLRYGGKTYVCYTFRGLFYGIAYTHDGEVRYRAAAKNATNLVFVGNGGNVLVAPLNDFRNPNAWKKVATPATGDLKDVVWAGTQFAAIGDRQLLLSTTGESWTLQTPPASMEPDYTEWRHVAYGGGKIFIYAAKNIGNGEWLERLFIYSGGGWQNPFDTKPHNCLGVVLRRFSFLNVTSTGKLVIGHGIKAGAYWDASLPWPVNLDEEDHFQVFDPSTLSFSAEWGERRSTGDTASYGDLVLRDHYAGYWYDGSKLTSIGYNQGRIQSTLSTNNGVAGTRYTVYSMADGGVLGMHSRGSSSITHNVTLAANPQPSQRGGLFVEPRGASSFFYYATLGLSGRLDVYLLTGGLYNSTRFAGEDESGNIALVVADSSSYKVFWGKPGQLTELYSGTHSGLYGYGAMAVSGKVFAVVGTRVFYYDGTSTYTFTGPPPPFAVALSGTDFHIIASDGVYKVGSSGVNRVIAETNLVGGADAPAGFIYYVKNTGGVYKYDFGASAATLIGTLPVAPASAFGAEMSGGLVLEVSSGSTRTLYIYDSGTSSFQSLGNPLAASVFLGLPPPPSTPSDEIEAEQEITLPPNTIVWTEPGMINLCTAYSYHTIVPRASFSITGLTSSPAGVVVMMENEMYVGTGTFADIRTTRIAPYPATVGHDPGARYGQAGSTIFVVWGGRVYAVDGGQATLISYQVDDGVPFVGIAYDGKRNMLVARKSDGRVLRYDIARQVWFDDMEDCLDIIESVDGVYYLREHDGARRIYAIANEDAEPSWFYYRIPQEIWIDAVRLEGEDIKRLRAIYADFDAKGPVNCTVSIYNENEAEVLKAQMAPAIGANAYGLGRYRLRFPPVVSYVPKRIKFTFSGFNFTMSPVIVLEYEARRRRV